jgi:hypothetical protein
VARAVSYPARGVQSVWPQVLGSLGSLGFLGFLGALGFFDSLLGFLSRWSSMACSALVREALWFGNETTATLVRCK